MAYLGKRRRAARESDPPASKCCRQSRSPSKQHEDGEDEIEEKQQWQGFCEIESDPVRAFTLIKFWICVDS